MNDKPDFKMKVWTRREVEGQATSSAQAAADIRKASQLVGSGDVVGGLAAPFTTAEAYFQDCDAFVRYVEDEVNPARAAEGLSTCDPRAAAHLYDVLYSRRYRQPSGKTPNNQGQTPAT